MFSVPDGRAAHVADDATGLAIEAKQRAPQLHRRADRLLEGLVEVERGVLGRGDRWWISGKDWCAWNAVFGPRGADGLPKPLWDGRTGVIDHSVLEHWKMYDLRLVLESNWSTLEPKLRGKIHLWVGDADNYFLNNAVHLLDEFLSEAEPPFQGRIIYGPGKGHGWSDISMRDMMKEMEAATGGAVGE